MPDLPVGAVTRDNKSVAVGSDATDAFLRGDIGFAAGSDVEVRSADGKATRVKAEQLGAYLQDNPLAKLVGQGTVAKQQRQADIEGSLLSQAGALGSGFVRELLLGAGDAALIKTAGLVGGEKSAANMRQRIADYDEVYSGTRGVGQAAGFLAPIVASLGSGALVRGGVGGAAKLATLAPRGLSAVSGAVERGVAGAVGEGLAGRALAMGAQGALEGAVYGAGDKISQAAVQNQNLTAESILAAMGHGALIGGAGGGLLGAASGVAARGAKTGTEKLESLIAAAKSDERIQALAQSLDKTLPTSVQNLENLAQRKSLAVVAGGSETAMRALDNLGERVQVAASKIALEELPALNKKTFATLSREELAAGAQQLKNAAKTEELLTLKQLDSLPAREGFQRFETQPIRETLAQVTTLSERDALRLEKTLAKVDRADTVGAQYRLKNLIEESASIPQNVKSQALEAIDQQIAYRIERRGAELGEAWGRELESRTARRQAADWLSNAASVPVESPQLLDLAKAALAGDRAVSSAVGAGVGAAMGPLAGAVAGPVAGAIAGAGKQYFAQTVRNASDAIIADVASRVATQGLVQSITKTVGDTVAHGVGSALKLNPTAVGEVAKQTAAGLALGGLKAGAAVTAPPLPKLPESREGLEKLFASRAALASVPRGAQVAAFKQALTPIAESNADLASASLLKFVQSADFLRAKLPQPTVSAETTLQPHLEKPRYSPDDMAKFLRYQQAVDNPLGVIQSAARGVVSREGSEVLRTLYPELSAQLDRALVQGASIKKTPLQYAEKIRLSALTGRPLDPTLTPQFVNSIQSLYSAPEQQRPPPRPINLKRALYTEDEPK